LVVGNEHYLPRAHSIGYPNRFDAGYLTTEVDYFNIGSVDQKYCIRMTPKSSVSSPLLRFRHRKEIQHRQFSLSGHETETGSNCVERTNMSRVYSFPIGCK